MDSFCYRILHFYERVTYSVFVHFQIYVAQLTPQIAFKFIRTDTIDAGKSVTTNATTDVTRTASKSKINSANDIRTYNIKLLP